MPAAERQQVVEVGGAAVESVHEVVQFAPSERSLTPGERAAVTERLVDIGDDVLEEARRVLGTTTVDDTVNAALRETVRRGRPLTSEDLAAFADATKDSRDPEVMARAWK